MTNQRPGEVARGEGYNWRAMGAHIISDGGGLSAQLLESAPPSLAVFFVCTLFAKNMTGDRTTNTVNQPHPPAGAGRQNGGAFGGKAQKAKKQRQHIIGSFFPYALFF